MSIQVAWREHAFVGRPVVVQMQHGRTITELVAAGIASHGLKGDFLWRGEVRVNNELVPRDMWDYVRPRVRKDHEIVVTFHYRVGDFGSGGGGNLLASLAMIAVLVAAVIVAPYLAGLIVPAGFAATAGTISLIQGGLVVLGALAVGALTAPPALPQQESAASPKDLSGKPASLSGNVLAPDSTVPAVFGPFRVFPPMGCQPLTDIVDGSQRLETVYVLSEWHSFTDFRFGNVSISDLPDIELEAQDGGPSSLIQSLVPRYGRTVTSNLTLSQHITDAAARYRLKNQAQPDDDVPQYHVVRTASTWDEFWMMFVWRSGLFRNDSATAKINQAIRFQVRRKGTNTWVSLPEIHFSNDSFGTIQKMVKFVRGTAPVAIPLPPTDRAPIYAFKHVPPQTIGPTTSGWDADASFSAGAGNDYLSNATVITSNVRNVVLTPDAVIIYLDPSVFPDDQYDVRFKQSIGYQDAAFTASTYVYSGGDTPVGTWAGGSVVFDFFQYFNGNDGYFDLPFNPARIQNLVDVPQVSSVKNRNPIASRDFAHIAVRFTGKNLDQFSVLAARYSPDYDSVAGTWTDWRPDANLAAHIRSVMTGTLNDDPLPEDLVDDLDLLDLRQFSIDNAYECKMIADGKSARQVVDTITACSFAKYRACEKHGVLIDRDRGGELPTQVFSFRNMRSMQFAKSLDKTSTGFRVDFPDEDNNFERKPIIVYNPLDATPSGSRLDAMSLEGITEEWAAIERAEHDQKQLRLRMAFFRGEVPPEVINCRRGDLVGVNHDVLSNHAGAAYIKTVQISGPNTIGLVLDGTIPIVSADAWESSNDAWTLYSDAFVAAQTGVAIRLMDGTILAKEVTAVGEETNIITFVTPFATLAALQPGCLVVSGDLGAEYSRMLVFNIEPSQDMAAQITFVPEANEIFDPPSAKQIVDRLGLGANTVLCLDAGARASYRGTGYLYDLSSGKNHFYLGQDATIETTDPSFVGNINKRSMHDYLSFDGGDFVDEVVDGAWDVSFHKDGALWTMAFIVYYVGGNLRILTNRNSNANVGFLLHVDTGPLALRRSNGSVNQDLNFGTVSTNAWHFLAVSMNENGGASGSHWCIDGTTGTFDGAATSPSASSPAFKSRLFANPPGAGTTFAPSGSRFMAGTVLNRNLSQAELASVYDMWLKKRLT